MDKYIVVTTFCDKEEIVIQIRDELLKKRLVASGQISQVHSKYWWNNTLEETEEYKLELRTKESNFKKIEEQIRKMHNYDVAEISSYEIINSNKEFLTWIDENIK